MLRPTHVGVSQKLRVPVRAYIGVYRDNKVEGFPKSAVLFWESQL